MLRTALVLPVLTVVSLVVALFGVGVPSATAQEVASVTIYKTQCPAGFEGEDQADLYNNCYGNPVAGQAFSAQQGKSDEAPAVDATGADGMVSLPLYGGATTISEGLPPGISEYFVFCSHEDGSPVEFEYTGDTFGIFLEEEGGDYYPNGSHIHCDWYNIPAADGGNGGEEGRVTIYRTSCPAGYAGDDYYNDCYDNPQAGIQFIIRAAGSDVGAGFSTGPDGYTAGFLPLQSPGTVVITESPLIGEPLPYQDYVVYCSKDGGVTAISIDYGQSGVMDIVFDAAPTDAIHCDWFYVPPAGDGGDNGDDTVEGSLTLYVTACPPGFTGDDYYPECYDNPQAGVGFAASARIGVIAEAESDANGFVTYSFEQLGVFEPPAAGEHEAGISIGIATDADDFAVYCSKNGGDAVEVFALAGGPAGLPGVGIPGEDVEPGDDIRCDWYLLTEPDGGDDDADAGGPVTRLPNTGSGGVTGQESSLPGTLVPIAVAAIVATLGAAAYATRRALA